MNLLKISHWSDQRWANMWLEKDESGNSVVLETVSMDVFSEAVVTLWCDDQLDDVLGLVQMTAAVATAGGLDSEVCALHLLALPFCCSASACSAFLALCLLALRL